MMYSIILMTSVIFVSLSALVNAHGYHPKAGSTKPADWAVYHMAGMFKTFISSRAAIDHFPPPQPLRVATDRYLEEHHIDNFDPGSFFALHDYDGNGAWDKAEVRRTYGLDDESNADLTEAHIQQILQDVFALFDQDHTGGISREEYLQRHASGFRLPDFGHGPGHHGDDEYEYEIHHFEKFHDENTREEDLTHPEDIAHFRKHDLEEDERERLEKLEQRPIVEENIPGKFRRD
jgi:hypothetical protein